MPGRKRIRNQQKEQHVCSKSSVWGVTTSNYISQARWAFYQARGYHINLAVTNYPNPIQPAPQNQYQQYQQQGTMISDMNFRSNQYGQMQYTVPQMSSVQWFLTILVKISKMMKPHNDLWIWWNKLTLNYILYSHN